MTVPVPPPPRSAPGNGHQRAATVALAASISGFVIFPVVGPLIGIVIGFAVVWALRGAPDAASRRAAIAVAVGSAGVAVPVVAILFVRARDDLTALVAACAVLASIVGVTMHLAGVGGRASLAVSAGSVVAVIATTVAAVGAVLVATWILVAIGRLIITAVFGATLVTIGAW